MMKKLMDRRDCDASGEALDRSLVSCLGHPLLLLEEINMNTVIVTKRKHSLLGLTALLGGVLISFNTYAVHTATYTNTYTIGPLSTTPYVNTGTVAGLFSDRYNFSILAPSTTAGSAVTLNLNLGNFGFHITGLSLDLYSAGGTLFGSDTVTGAGDTAVNVNAILATGNYFFREMGTGDGNTTGQGLYAFTAVAAPVPEMDTYALMLAGLGLVGFAVSRRHTS